MAGGVANRQCRHEGARKRPCKGSSCMGPALQADTSDRERKAERERLGYHSKCLINYLFLVCNVVGNTDFGI